MKTPRINDFDPNAKEPTLNSPLENMPSIQKPKKEEQNTGLPANPQTSKSVSQQVGLSANPFASKPANPQTSKLLKKFTSYLTQDSIKALKRIAFDSDRKDYEVLQEAVNSFIKRIEK